MARVTIEVVAVLIAAAFAFLALRIPIATDGEVNFWITLIGGGAISEGSRFILFSRFHR
jgi:hypothetical protein